GACGQDDAAKITIRAEVPRGSPEVHRPRCTTGRPRRDTCDRASTCASTCGRPSSSVVFPAVREGSFVDEAGEVGQVAEVVAGEALLADVLHHFVQGRDELAEVFLVEEDLVLLVTVLVDALALGDGD